MNMNTILFTLLIFLFIARLGAALYKYLRKEQEKLTASNKASEIEIESTKKKKFSEGFFKDLSVTLNSFKNNFFLNRKFRFMAFVSTYVAAMLLTLIVLGVFVHPVIPFFLIFFFQYRYLNSLWGYLD